MKRIIKSEPANPNIANAFFRAGYIEVWERGTTNVIKYCTDAGLPEPIYTDELGGVAIVFSTKHNQTNEERFSIDYGEKDTVKDTINILSKNEEKMFELIKRDRKITTEELSNNVGINLRNIKKNIRKLKEKGLLKRIGPDKGGHWEVIEE